jgi:TRAP-type C4-dicarboxylate transport system substrate-binding protein
MMSSMRDLEIGSKHLAGPVLALLAGGWLSGASAQEVALKLHHLVPPVAIAHSAMLTPWAEKVERESGGRIAIEIYPSMHLGGQPPALIDQVREGIVDIVWTLPGYTPGRFPMIEVFELPFLNAQPIVTNFAIAEFIDNHPEEFAEYKVISAFVHAGQLIHSTAPIRTAEDFRGLKIRIPTRVAGWMVESWGAIPLGTTVQKIPEMLSKRIVDGTLVPFEAAYGLQVHDLVDYNVFRDDPISERFNGQVLMIAMNRAVYEGLAPDLRAVIDANSGRNIARWIGEVWTRAEEPGENAARAAGNEFIYLSQAEVAKLRELSETPVAERWISVVAKKGIDGRPLIAEAKRLIEKYQAQEGEPAQADRRQGSPQRIASSAQ